jgi:hypothetical protein
MREAIIVGVVVGLLFFAAGVVMTALAVKYATNSLLWDVVLWSGVALMVASVATLGLYIYSQSNGGAFWIPALLVNLGICAIISGIAYTNSTAPDVAHPSPLAAQPPIAPSILLDIAFEILPRISPPDGTIHMFEISEKQSGIEAFPIEYQLKPSDVIDWRQFFPDWPIFGISKCEITSTANESVFDAVIPLNLIFREMIPDKPGLPPVEIGGVVQATTGGTQMRSGRVMMTQRSEFRVGRIYPQTPYVIYFVNRTKYLVDIELTSEGKVQDFSKTGADFEKPLSMKLGRTMGLHLVPTPTAPKSPPTLPPPTPLQPDKPEKK